MSLQDHTSSVSTCNSNVSTVKNSPSQSNKCDVNTWHKRLGHPSSKVLSKVLNSDNVNVQMHKLDFCSACPVGKMHQFPFSASNSHSSYPFDLVHSDIWGPAHDVSTDGFKYYIHFIDDYSRFT